MPELEERQAKIEGVLEQIDKRVGRLESGITRLEDKIDLLRDELLGKIDSVDSKIDSVRDGLLGKIDSLRNEGNTNFRWLMGIMITMWVTVILTIIFKG